MPYAPQLNMNVSVIKEIQMHVQMHVQSSEETTPGAYGTESQETEYTDHISLICC